MLKEKPNVDLAVVPSEYEILDAEGLGQSVFSTSAISSFVRARAVRPIRTNTL